jgi:hypothetical protein
MVMLIREKDNDAQIALVWHLVVVVVVPALFSCFYFSTSNPPRA